MKKRAKEVVKKGEEFFRGSLISRFFLQSRKTGN